MENLKANIDEFPVSPKDQNIVWYKLSKLHAGKASVKDSHKQYLLLRDVTSFSFLILLLTFVSQFFFEISLKTKLIYLSLLIIQYLITAHAGTTYGNRFVCNVLAEESSRNEGQA
jgi:inner membrane protein involved in colicin E2 resistance